MAKQACSRVAAGRRKGKVIRCVFPDGRDEVRFVALNLKLGCLDFFEVFIDNDEKVTLGEATRAPFAAIKVAGADGNVVRISSQSGMLVEMTFAQGPGHAKAWADFINQARKADTSKLPQEGAGLGAQLRAAVAKQEEQVRLLEALVQRKGEQQQQLQAHLEGLLERLDLGRELFAEQEQVPSLEPFPFPLRVDRKRPVSKMPCKPQPAVAPQPGLGRVDSLRKTLMTQRKSGLCLVFI
ncbi:unnamed protein product [Symbiodinium sp. CCMP2456]|nr:unnamed protein product [Symbiodinium sp. CCMP2456]